MPPDVTVFLSAGELSGDAYGGQLARALRRRRPDIRFLGVGGPSMAAAGVELIAMDVLMKALVEEITEGGRKNEKPD